MSDKLTKAAAGAYPHHKLARLTRISSFITIEECQDEEAETPCMIWNGPTDGYGEPRDRDDSHKVYVRKYLWMLTRPNVLWPKGFEDYYHNVFYGYLEQNHSDKGGVKSLEIETPHSFPEGYEAKILYERGDIIVPCCGSKDCVNPEHLTMIFPSQRRDYDFSINKEFFRKISISDEIIDRIKELDMEQGEGVALLAKHLVKDLNISHPTAYRYLAEYKRMSGSKRILAEREILEHDYFEFKDCGDPLSALLKLSTFSARDSEPFLHDPGNLRLIEGWIKTPRETNLEVLGRTALARNMAENGRLPSSSNFKHSRSKPTNKLSDKVMEFVNNLYMNEDLIAELLANYERLEARVKQLEEEKINYPFTPDNMTEPVILEQNLSSETEDKEIVTINRPGGCMEDDGDYLDLRLGDNKDAYKEWLKTTWPRDFFSLVDYLSPEEYWNTFPKAAFFDYNQIHGFIYAPENVEKWMSQGDPWDKIFNTRSWVDLRDSIDEDAMAMKMAQDISPKRQSDVISYAISTDVGEEEILEEINRLDDTRCMRVVAYYSSDKVVVNTLVHSDENGGEIGYRDLLYIGKGYNVFE